MKSILLLALTLFVSTSLVADAASRKKEESIEELSRDAYVWGYPAVLMNHVQKAMLEKVKSHETPINHFIHANAVPDPFLGHFVAVNPENLYSWAWIDLRKEPLVMTHPEIKDRFYSVQLVDAYSTVFQTISNETQGNKSADFVLTPPGWKGRLPENLVQIKAPTPQIFVLAQTFVKDAKDLSKVQKLNAQRHLITLSNWSQGITVDSFKNSYPRSPLIFDKNLATQGVQFYETLNQIVAINPPPTSASRTEMMRFTRLGTKNPAQLQSLIGVNDNRLALERGIFEGERQIQNRLASGFGAKVNGWAYELKAAPFTDNYLLRAAASQRYLFSSPAEETLQLILEADSESRQLSSSYKYVLHFETDQFPPALTMWSLRTHEMKSKNPEDLARAVAVINDHGSALKYNMDGSMDILLQNEKPAASLVSNWLPLSKNANFYVVLTLFNPNNSAMNRKYIPPSLTRVEEGRIPKQRVTRTMMAKAQEAVSK